MFAVCCSWFALPVADDVSATLNYCQKTVVLLNPFLGMYNCEKLHKTNHFREHPHDREAVNTEYDGRGDKKDM